ncbi:PIG-L family deacetylase [Ilumatobacter sp.]|uniref:PIG-L family deacetylase n=1 Tax=Ilumatobacter sp. TaxID=1967498 RepID=UPI003AF6D6C1
MGTLLCFHAHPDDEAIATGGSMARAHAEGHRVVLVVATDGAHGEVPDDLGSDESLADRRRSETAVSAAALGIDRVEFLGFTDSGMNGWDANDHDGSFWQADTDEAAVRLAAILLDEQVDVLTIYDWHGGYGHPDHIKVHRVGVRAAELVAERMPTMRVLEATMNRDEMRRGIEMAKEMGADDFGPTDDHGEEFDPDAPMDDGNPMGTPESELTLGIDVSPFVERKRAAIAAHRSQVSDQSFFLQMPTELFAQAFGREWFIEHDREADGSGPRLGWMFD